MSVSQIKCTRKHLFLASRTYHQENCFCYSITLLEFSVGPSWLRDNDDDDDDDDDDCKT